MPPADDVGSQGPATGIVGGEGADPGVEDLHGLSAVLDLGFQIGGHRVREEVNQSVEIFRVVVCE